MVAGLKHARRNDVANIVRRSATISRARSSPWGWQAVRIFGKGQLSSENCPSRRFYMGRTMSRLPGRSARREGPDYLLLKLNDPSFIAPIYADLFDEVEGATCSGYGRGRTVSGRLASPHELTGRGFIRPQPSCSAAAASGQSVYLSANRLTCAHTRARTGDRSNEKSSLLSNRAVNFGHVMAYIEETRPLSRLVYEQKR
ncbi:hypothetical protein ACVWWI_006469 [Bradyrhizobium sp. USDA 3686]|nr:hypothetical protein [Bradyrhizobium canariense]